MTGGDGVDRAGRPDWLDIQDLSVAFPGPDGMVQAVRGISLSMAAGKGWRSWERAGRANRSRCAR
ncbi:hypothetical protein ACFQ4K_00725 [Tistrella bauzanensis]